MTIFYLLLLLLGLISLSEADGYSNKKPKEPYPDSRPSSYPEPIPLPREEYIPPDNSPPISCYPPEDDIDTCLNSGVYTLNKLTNNNNDYAPVFKLAADCLDGFNSGNYDDSTKKTISQSLKRLNKAVKSAKKCRRYAKNQTTMSDCSSILQQSKYKQKNANQMKIVIDACSTCIENYC